MLYVSLDLRLFELPGLPDEAPEVLWVVPTIQAGEKPTLANRPLEAYRLTPELLARIRWQVGEAESKFLAGSLPEAKWDRLLARFLALWDASAHGIDSGAYSLVWNALVASQGPQEGLPKCQEKSPWCPWWVPQRKREGEKQGEKVAPGGAAVALGGAGAQHPHPVDIKTGTGARLRKAVPA